MTVNSTEATIDHSGLQEIDLFPVDEEEERDKVSIELQIKKYHKLLRFLFDKYSNTGYVNNNIKNFEDITKRKSVMHLAEFYKMLKDHGISSRIIKKNDLTNLMRSMNKHLKGRGDLSPLSGDEFIDFFFQTAYYIYSRPPFDLSSKPPVETLNAMFEQFKTAAK